MKIVFISLPAPYLDEPAMNPPLGICYISAYLKEREFKDIRLIDFCLYKNYDYYNNSDYLNEIPLDADVYGISVISPQFKWLIEVCHYLREKNPNSLLITGGPHSSNLPEDFLMGEHNCVPSISQSPVPIKDDRYKHCQIPTNPQDYLP